MRCNQKDNSHGDTCSWKGQLEKAKSWKVLSWNVRHEIGNNEVGKFGMNLLSTTEVGKELMKLESFEWHFPTSVTTFQVHLNFPTSARMFQLQWNFPTSAKLFNLKKTFQLRSVLSNFALFSPTSLGSFQLQRNFPTSNFPT